MAKAERPRNARRLVLRRVLFVLLLLVASALIAGRLGEAYPTLDLANLATVPAAIAAIMLASALALLTRRWIKRAVYALVMLAAAYLLIPPPSAIGECSDDAARLRVAWLNLQGSTTPAPILAWLDKEQPDVVGFAELHATVEPTRSVLAARYPYSQSCLANGRCSTILYTGTRPVAAKALSRGDVQNRKSLSAARMTLATSDAQAVHIMAVHLSRAPHTQRQRDELGQLQLLLENPADTVVIGDFNMVRRMQGMRKFAEGSGLTASPADRSTWPLRWRGKDATPIIQIDHVLTGRNWRVESLRTSDALGSDHRGIVADLCRVN